MDMRKRMEDYMRKREELAIDSQARLGKLDAAYNNQGTNFGAMAGFADALSGGQTNYSQLAKSADDDRISPQKYALLREKLQNNQVNNYGALTKDAMNSLRQDALTNQWAKKASLKERLAGMKPKKDKSIGWLTRKSMIDFGQRGIHNFSKALMSPNFSMVDTQIALQTKKTSTDASMAINQFNQGLGRLFSGAAIGSDEWKQFTALLVSPFDSKEQMRKKMKEANRFFDSSLKDMGLQSSAADAPTATQSSGSSYDGMSEADIDAELARRGL